MKTQIAIALTATYAAAVGTQGACNGYFAGLVSDGWECSFKDLKLETCTNSSGAKFDTVAKAGVSEYDQSCKEAAGTYLTWAQPTAATCKKWTDAKATDGKEYVATAADKETDEWIEACYKAGALNLTAFGAAAVAAIAALAF